MDQEAQSIVIEREPEHSQGASSRAVGLATGFAILRGLMLALVSAVLIVAPETAMPGSSTEPARSLAIIVASRTILLGVVLVALAIRRKREALSWLLFADAVLQIYDTGMALVVGKGALAVLPAALGAMDLWAGLSLLRAARGPQRPPGK